MKRFLRRAYWTWIIWSGNARKCNRVYWGWVKLRTAWAAAKCLIKDSNER